VWLLPDDVGIDGNSSDGVELDDDTDNTPEQVGDEVGRIARDWNDDGRLKERETAARAVLAYAREHETVSKQNMKK
jgi:hypothetical protein